MQQTVRFDYRTRLRFWLMFHLARNNDFFQKIIRLISVIFSRV